jgi:hypothetical protein
MEQYLKGALSIIIMSDGSTDIKVIAISNKKKDILKAMLALIGISYTNIADIVGVSISRDSLLDDTVVTGLMAFQAELRNCGYKSGKLTSLHKNNESNQKFPAINMVRQILKCNGYKLSPYVINIGYNIETGNKITRRFFKINNIE